MLRYVRFWLCLWVYLLISVSGFSAQDGLSLSLERKAVLQASLSHYIASVSSEDGGFSYLDRQDARIKTAYPASLHPKILIIGDSYFLCITMLDEAGNKIEADFLLRAKTNAHLPLSPDDFIVTDTIIGNRALLKAAMIQAATSAQDS